jgi:hypothetical protein
MAEADYVQGEGAVSLVYPKPPVKRREMYGGKPSIKAPIERALIGEMGRLGWPEGDLRARARVTSGRFLYYRLESQGVVDKAHPKHADRVSEVITDLLWSGVFPLWSIVDRGRDVIHNSAYPSIVAGLHEVVEGISLDPWQGKAPKPFLIMESDSLAGVLEDLALEFHTPVAPLRGQASTGMCFDIVRAVIDHGSVRVGYLGDWDFAGGHIRSSAVEARRGAAGALPAEQGHAPDRPRRPARDHRAADLRQRPAGDPEVRPAHAEVEPRRRDGGTRPGRDRTNRACLARRPPARARTRLARRPAPAGAEGARAGARPTERHGGRIVTTLNTSLDESVTAYIEWFCALANKLFERTESGELFLKRDGLYADALVHASVDYAGLRLGLHVLVLDDERGRQEAERSYLLRGGWTLDATTDPDPLTLLRELNDRIAAGAKEETE